VILSCNSKPDTMAYSWYHWLFVFIMLQEVATMLNKCFTYSLNFVFSYMTQNRIKFNKQTLACKNCIWAVWLNGNICCILTCTGCANASLNIPVPIHESSFFGVSDVPSQEPVDVSPLEYNESSPGTMNHEPCVSVYSFNQFISSSAYV
jgi:hypothetical protein